MTKFYRLIDIAKETGFSKAHILYYIRQGLIKPDFVVKRIKYNVYLFSEESFKKAVETIKNLKESNEYYEKILRNQ